MPMPMPVRFVTLPVINLFSSKSINQSINRIFFLQVPVPIVLPPQKKDVKDVAVQLECFAVSEEKKVEPVCSAGQCL